MKAGSEKPQRPKSVRVSVTFPKILFSFIEEKSIKAGYSGISDYLQAIARRDIGLEKAAA
jgi:metal-responsive CopG/Arc/MetJ family transcriptional regulator